MYRLHTVWCILPLLRPTTKTFDMPSLFALVAILAAAVSPCMAYPDLFIKRAQSCTDLPSAGYGMSHGGYGSLAKLDR